MKQNVFFLGRRIYSYNAGGPSITPITDRLGSDIAGTKYFPFGEEASTTSQDREKFATYRRDATGLDYADQRYYSPALGRFLTGDTGPMVLTETASYNRYAYAWSDPVNLVDSDGRLPARIVFDAGPGGAEDARRGYVPNAAFFLSGWLRDYPPPDEQPGFDPRSLLKN
ncbi:MAG TPA: RHS repeat-associated core domain-containing protein [Bryobacteraceae bacterium]|nr:RHS repeat-associated core domain-containing protein [Bryobacteraceae bacterium]